MENEKKDLNELEKKFIEAGECGKKVQKLGQRLVNASEQGKEIIDIIKNNDDIFGDAQVQSWIVSANATIPNFQAYRTEPLESYILAVGTSSASATAFIPVYAHRYKKEYELSGEDNSELDEYLRDFTAEFSGVPDLVQVRKGAWDTYYSATEVNLMNASHSMREVMRHIISQIATNEEVKKASWWEKPKGTDKEVTNAQRLRYLIFGSVDDKPIEMVILAVKTSMDAYSRLQSIAHGSAGYREEVKTCLQQTEYALLTILRFRKLKAKGS